MSFSCCRLNGCNSKLIYLSVFSGVRAEEILSSFLLFQSTGTTGGRPNNCLVFVACGSAAAMLGACCEVKRSNRETLFQPECMGNCESERP